MQKGFASLEIILAVMIIAILATVAVPNANAVCVDGNDELVGRSISMAKA